MTKEEIVDFLIKCGLDKDTSNYYANLELEDKHFAWLSAFRFVRPLNNTLEFYKNEYVDLLEKHVNDGFYASEIENAILNSGVDKELLGAFAYEIALKAFNEVLYNLVDPPSLDYDLENNGEDLPSCCLKELDKDDNETGRFITSTHNLIPFSNF